MFKDTRGLEMTASSQEAVDAFDATVAEFLAAGREAAVLLKHVNETDPDMIMGQCVRGYFMRLPQQAHLIQGSDDAYAKAVTLLDGANPREKMHVSALEAWCKGDIRRTNAIWEQILVEYPHDFVHGFIYAANGVIAIRQVSGIEGFIFVGHIAKIFNGQFRPLELFLRPTHERFGVIHADQREFLTF